MEARHREAVGVSSATSSVPSQGTEASEVTLPEGQWISIRSIAFCLPKPKCNWRSFEAWNPSPAMSR